MCSGRWAELIVTVLISSGTTAHDCLNDKLFVSLPLPEDRAVTHAGTGEKEQGKYAPTESSPALGRMSAAA